MQTEDLLETYCATATSKDGDRNRRKNTVKTKSGSGEEEVYYKVPQEGA